MVRADFHYGVTIEERALREEVFVREQGFVDEFDEIDDTSLHLNLYHNDALLAVGRLVKIDPETYQIGRVAVKKEARGKKVGTYLMKFLETKIKELGGRKAIVHSQLDKKGFYEKCHYRPLDGNIDEEQGVPHIYLIKILKK